MDGGRSETRSPASGSRIPASAPGHRHPLEVIALTLAGIVSSAQQPPTPLQSALAALGATNLRTLQFTATGNSYVLGQPATAADAWPVRPIKSYQVTLDYGSGSMRVEQVLTMPTPQPRGGGAPFNGEQRQVQVVRGAFAWNEAPAAAGAQGSVAQPQPAAAAERILWMWMASPQGLLKGTGTNTPTRAVADGADLAYTVGGRYPLVVHINKMNQVDRARTILPNDVFGDMVVETTYSGYRNFNGIPFPSRIVQTQGGHTTLDLTVTAVTANPFVDITVPDAVRTASAAAAPAPTSQKVAEGVFWITGGSHHSLAVDLGDHIAVVEAPQNEARSEAVIAETKKVIPNKPIRYVVNTHLHFDHSGGLRTYVDEGATIVTHAANQAFYEKAWAAPRTLSPDRLAKSAKKATFQTVTDRSELRGTNNRTIQLHVLQGNPHNEQTLIAWLPAEKILFQSDMINPPAQGAQVPPPTPTITNFYDNLVRLKIEPDQIVGGHGNRIANRADLNAVAGKAGTN
jgi:glyoxylase-like metal-dependent hydrolase (beta-lactamase superfamily II)